MRCCSFEVAVFLWRSEKAIRTELLKMAFSYVLKTSLKWGVVVGLAYESVHRGFWGTSEQSVAAWNRLREQVQIPTAFKQQIQKIDMQEVPKLDSFMKKSVGEYWNSGVVWSFKGLAALPCTVTHYSKMAWEKAVQEINKTTEKK